MYLSDLCGRLQQVLKEHGDMQVVRLKNVAIEGLSTAPDKNYKDIESNYFYILNEIKNVEGQNTKTESKFVLL